MGVAKRRRDSARGLYDDSRRIVGHECTSRKNDRDLHAYLHLLLLTMAAIGSRASIGAEANRHISGQQAWKENLKESHAQAITRANAAHVASRHASGTVHEAAVSTKSASGSPYTIENLIARVETNPKRFASYHSLHATVIIQRDIQLRAMIAQGLCPPLNGIYHGGLLCRPLIIATWRIAGA